MRREFMLFESLEQIPPRDWEYLFASGHDTLPFFERSWLRAYELSGSMTASTGWHPLHLVVYEDGRALMALPLYIKDHSMGEFVFDFMFADAAAQLGREYYPKAVGVIPATPVTAYAPLTAPDCSAGSSTRRKVLGEALDFLLSELPRRGVKSLSFLFAQADFSDELESLGWHRWVHQGFLWEKGEDKVFSDYLARFTKNQRRNIRREQASLEQQGLEVLFETGPQLSEEHALDMYELYLKTNEQFGPWAARFLNRDFFLRVFAECADHIVLVSARSRETGHIPGRSMLVRSSQGLYGRYWGSREFVPDLHFNLCYYEPIHYALREGLEYFDPGMGGEHKMRRGFHPVRQYSMHRFFDPLMDRIFAANIPRFNEHALMNIELIRQALPEKGL